MRRMVPEMQAALRGTMNSNPSHETSVTNSEVAGSAMAMLLRMVWLAQLESQTGGRTIYRVFLDFGDLQAFA